MNLQMNPQRRSLLIWGATWVASAAAAVTAYRVVSLRGLMGLSTKQHHKPAGREKGSDAKRFWRKAKAKEPSRNSEFMQVSKSGIVHWPNGLLFKTHYKFKVIDTFRPDDWIKQMKGGAFTRRKTVEEMRVLKGSASQTGPRAFIEPRLSALPKKRALELEEYSAQRHFFGARELTIRETLALACLEIDGSQGAPSFKNIENALAVLEPALSRGRRGHRLTLLYVRLVCLQNEYDISIASERLGRAFDELPEPKQHDRQRTRIRESSRVPESQNVLHEFKKFHSKTVDRRTGHNTFRVKLTRRVKFAKQAMHASLCDMGSCSSNGQDTHLRDKGSTPLQAPLQYRHRSIAGYFRRRMRNFRKWLNRKIQPWPSRRAKRSEPHNS